MDTTRTMPQPKNRLGYFKQALSSTGITNSLGALMSQKQMGRFKSTLVQIVTGNELLLQCSPKSVIGAGSKAAALGLDISPAFGYCCIIPFKTKAGYIAVFQLMVNGWIQLAVRSGLYEWINADAVYEDEYRGYEMLSGIIQIEKVDGGYRDQGRKDKIIGFYAAYRLISGAGKVIYWTVRQIEIHARTYSSDYRKKHGLPLPADWKGPDLYSTGIGWEKGWYAMALKTVLKQLIRKWGPLSPEMQEAMDEDYTDGTDEYTADFEEFDAEAVAAIEDGDTPESAQNAPEDSRAETTHPEPENAPESQEIGNAAKPQADNASAIAAMFASGARL